jgi:lipopolysaccharide transport system permease protein
MLSNHNSALQSAYRFCQLVLVKVRFNIRAEAAKSYLSYSWWILEPILQMTVYYIVFGIFLKRGTDNFVPFLLCGIVGWLWFSKSVSNSSGSIVGGKGLINQTYITKAFFPLVIICQDMLKQAFVFLLLLAFLVLYGFTPEFNWLWLIPIILTQLLLIVAVSFFVAFIVPFAHDLKFLINTGLKLMMFGSGIFYSYLDVLIPKHREIFLLNPMANIIVNYRLVLMEGSEPMTMSLSVIAAVSLIIIVFMHKMMKHYDNKLTRLVLST